MPWNWTQPDWPGFRYKPDRLIALEQQFLLSSGEIIGAVRHVSAEERARLRIELLSEEAMRTSAIEGEMLDRASVQSSLQRHFGLQAIGAPAKPREQGIAELMVNVYGSFAAPLSHDMLHRWHAMLLAHDRRLDSVGAYRHHDDTMQILSGRLDRPTVHFVAPPSAQVPGEMEAFVRWFNESAPSGLTPLPALTRAALGHLWFESIHPFEDGNGRMGRALAEKSLAQSIGKPSLIALSYAIERDRRRYYDQLESHQKTLDVTEWLLWFGETVLRAQQVTLEHIGFFIAKAKFYDRYGDSLNERQAKVIERMFREGPKGFQGGLSAENYLAITRTSRATATRDLHDLVQKGAFTRSGERRHTRYALCLASSTE